MSIPPLLRDLLTAVGPSGQEGPAAAVWRDAAAGFAEVSSDTLGTSFARVAAGEQAPTLALVGHIDEIGVAITHIGDDGLLAFGVLGGFDPEQMLGQRVLIVGRDRAVTGVVGRRLLSREERRDRPALKHSDLHIDVGASSRADAEQLARPGDAAGWACGGGPSGCGGGSRSSSRTTASRRAHSTTASAPTRCSRQRVGWQ